MQDVNILYVFDVFCCTSMPFKAVSECKQHAFFMHTHDFKVAYWMNHWEENRPNLTFLHGFPSASWDWHHQWNALKKDFNLLACDFLGFGLSDKPTHYSYSLLLQADVIERLWRHLRVKHSHLIAHDYGVSVAQELVSRACEKQLAATLETTLFLNGGLFAELHRPLLTQTLLASPFGWLIAKLLGKNKLRKSFNAIFGNDTPPSDSEIEAIWQLLQINNGQAVIHKLLGYIAERKIHSDRWVDAMLATDVKLAFVNGTQDPISGKHMLDKFREVLPSAGILPIDVGHYPQIESPQIVTKAIRQFIESNGVRLA